MGQIVVVKFFATLSRDLRKLLPDAEGLTEGNLRYAKRFYQLYSDSKKLFPQVAEELPKVPWGHHRLLIDKFKLLFGDYSLLLPKCLEK